ncbi:MAG: phage distal tail protein, Rcc01695 family [Pseudomonadota bacterium]
MTAAFHEVLFPLDIALKSAGGPERRTEIVTFGSGREERNARWAHSRRRFDAGYGVKTLDALQTVVAFFEERRGQLHGFRWRDRLDHSSASPAAPVTPLDQVIGSGDGSRAQFQLVKSYGSVHAVYARPIAKPVAGSVRVAVAGAEKVSGIDFTCDPTTGLVTFLAGHVPGAGASVTAGFQFDVPVRFDTDYLEVDLSAFEAGAIPKIPLVEIRP